VVLPDAAAQPYFKAAHAVSMHLQVRGAP